MKLVPDPANATRSLLDPEDSERYICGCRVHCHIGRGERIHRHPCEDHPRMHDWVPVPIADHPDTPTTVKGGRYDFRSNHA